MDNIGQGLAELAIKVEERTKERINEAIQAERRRIADYLVSNKICPAVENLCETPGFMESCCFCCWSTVLDKEKR